MADRSELEARLLALGSELAWPPTPDVRPAVRLRLASRRPWFATRWALAAVALLVIVATLLVYAPTRTAIAGWLNLHTTINRTTTLPTPSPLGPGPLGKRLGLGNKTTLQAARAGVAWTVLVPASLGQPDEAYLQTTGSPSLGEVTLVYGPRPGIPTSGTTGVGVLVTEARGRVNEQFFGKILASGTTIEAVTVNGHQGWWISGQPHFVMFIDAAGDAFSEDMRLATNTLLLDDNGTVVRIEGDLTRQQALDIAASLS